jgi:hypothetical protein
MKFNKKVMPPRLCNFQFHSFNHFEMAVVQTSEKDAKAEPVSLGLSRVKFDNHGNQIIVMRQLKPHLRNTGSHSLTRCLTIATRTGDVTVKSKV